MSNGGRAHSLVTDKYLVDLCNGLPHLEELAIDIARDKDGNDWPYSALDIISRFSRLRTVQLRFELGDGGAVLPTPYVTVSAARQLFSYLLERNKNIQRLELGSRARSVFAFVLDQPSWGKQNSISLVCERYIRDDDAAEGFLRVTCPDLSKEMNAELSRLAKGNRGRGGEDCSRMQRDYLSRLLLMDRSLWTSGRLGRSYRACAGIRLTAGKHLYLGGSFQVL
jgi:hypothetical protein